MKRIIFALSVFLLLQSHAFSAEEKLGQVPDHTDHMRIDELERSVSNIDRRLSRLEDKIDNVNRDVQDLKRKV